MVASGVMEEVKRGGGGRPGKSNGGDDGRTQQDRKVGDRGEQREDACGGFQLVEGGGSSLDGVPGGAACEGEHVAGGGSDPQGGKGLL